MEEVFGQSSIGNDCRFPFSASAELRQITEGNDAVTHSFLELHVVERILRGKKEPTSGVGRYNEGSL